MPSYMGNKFCHSNSVTFGAKKNKRNLMTRLSGITITETKTFVRLEKFTWWKPLKHTDFENSPKSPPSLHSLFYLVACRRHRLVDFLWHFYAKKSNYRGFNLCQSSWNEEGRMKDDAAYKGDLVKRNTLLWLRICYPNKFFH